MATKPKQPARTKTPAKKATPPPAARARTVVLLATDTPGVFRNRVGVLVDAKGIALAFKEIRKADDEHHTLVLGRPARTPLDVLEGVAFDPRNPQQVRVEAAKAAAPYRHAKRIAVGGDGSAPPVSFADMTNWTPEQVEAYEKGLRIAAQAAAGAATREGEEDPQ